jgi:hypothetical protein
MKATLATLVLLVFTAGTVYTQTRPVSPGDLPGLPDVERKSAAPKDTTIDQLLDQIVKLRQQKAEIEKKEQELMAEVQKKLGKQTERLNQLGIPAGTPNNSIPGGGIPPGGAPSPLSAPGGGPPPRGGGLPLPATAPGGTGLPTPDLVKPGSLPGTPSVRPAGAPPGGR